jgi:hypothetical protein
MAENHDASQEYLLSCLVCHAAIFRTSAGFGQEAARSGEQTRTESVSAVACILLLLSSPAFSNSPARFANWLANHPSYCVGSYLSARK